MILLYIFKKYIDRFFWIIFKMLIFIINVEDIVVHTVSVSYQSARWMLTFLLIFKIDSRERFHTANAFQLTAKTCEAPPIVENKSFQISIETWKLRLILGTGYSSWSVFYILFFFLSFSFAIGFRVFVFNKNALYTLDSFLRNLKDIKTPCPSEVTISVEKIIR